MEQAGRLRYVKPLAQKFHQPAILFDGQDFTGISQEQFRQRSQPRSDFEDFIRFFQFRRINDAPELVAIVQKILAEGFRQLNPARGQQFPHFRKLHREGLNHG